MRVGARSRRDAARAAAARSACRAAGAGGSGRQRRRGTHQARARDRRPRHRPPHQSRDRNHALPQRQDGRVAPAQHLPQARRLVEGRGRPRDGAPRRRGRRRRRDDLGAAGRSGCRPARGAGVPAGALPRSARLGQCVARLCGDIPGRRPVRGRPRRDARRRSRLGLGAPGRARGPVLPARRLRRARVGVPDRRRRLPVDAAPHGSARTAG